MTDLTFSISKAAELTGIPRKIIAEIVAGLPADPGVEEIVAAFVSATRAEGGPANPPEHKPTDLFSQLQLAEMVGTYPLAVKKALKGIRPAVNKPRLKQYRLAQKNPAGKTVKQLLEQLQDPDSAEVRKRADLLDVQWKEIRNQQALKELVPYNEVLDQLQLVIHHLYQLLVVKQPRDLADKLIICKSSREMSALLKRESAKSFDDLRNNYKTIFGSS